MHLKRLNKAKQWSLVGALSLSASALAYAGTYFYSKAVAINKKDFTEDEYNMQDVYPDDPWTAEKEWYQAVKHDVMTIESDDGLTLSSLFIPAAKETNRVAIIAHGYSGSNKNMAPWSKLFHDLGFNLLIPDARGHGESDGDYIGFGWHERVDYLRWIDNMIERFGSESELILYGLSMGGATVMNVSGETLPSNVKAIIEDCGYSSVTKELAHQMKRMYKLPQFPFIPLASFVTKMKAGYWFGEANPEKQVKNSQTPLFFIHGEEDHFVPTHMVYDVYHAANCPKDLYVVPGAAHAYGYVTDKEEYRFRIKRFLDKYLDEETQSI